MRALCLYTGSSPGAVPAYREAAEALAVELAQRNIALVYGGGHVGLMGAAADAALAAGGRVVGVIPSDIAAREVEHHGLTELHVVGSMHERKMKMFSLSDAMIALPGGLGTMEELFEVWTWNQLGFHNKPIGLLNVAGYYDHLLAFLEQMVDQRFVHRAHRDLLQVGGSVPELLDRLARYQSTHVDKWLDQ